MPVLAIEHLRRMHGGAQAHLMRADDGHYYVVKFQNNPQHIRVLANEFIGARLARGMGLPVPEPVLVEVPQILIEANTEMVMRAAGLERPCSPGLQFGSRLPGEDPNSPVYDYLPEPALEQVANLIDFAGMLLFDKWTCNCNGRQVIFCRPVLRQPLRVFMIDQGFCFNAGEWKFPDSPLRGIYHRSLVYRNITGWDSFEPWLDKVENYAESAIYALGEELPPAWYGPWEDLQKLLNQLVRRRQLIRELVWSVKVSKRAPFESWTDDHYLTAVGAR